MKKKSISLARKTGVLLLGVPVIILGIALLVLPGPGLVVIIFGLVILSLEFEFARKYRDRARAEVKKAYERAKSANSKKSNKK